MTADELGEARRVGVARAPKAPAAKRTSPKGKSTGGAPQARPRKAASRARAKPMPRRCYGNPPPGLDLKALKGKLIVIEGQDSSGRSTHVSLLSSWLQQSGYAVVGVGLRRSELVGPELEEARGGNTLSPRTMSLFYASDFYDQLENRIVPALRAGAVVLADRYIFTLMARDLVRGADAEWVGNLYSKAIVPDLLVYLQATPRTLLERRLERHPGLDYWESGMDLGLSRDWYESFLQYQRRMSGIFQRLIPAYGFEVVDANRGVPTVNRDLKGRIEAFLKDWQG